MPWLTASRKAIGENSKAIRSLVENDEINDIRHDDNKKEHKLLFDKIEELQKEMRKDINRIDGAVRAITSAMSVDDARAEARRAAEARAETRRAFGRRAAADLGYNYEYDDNLDKDDIDELEDLVRRFGRKPSSSEEAMEWVNKFGDGR